jgi:hypothetical protein
MDTEYLLNDVRAARGELETGRGGKGRILRRATEGNER